MENVFIYQDKPYIEMYHQVRAEDGSKGVVVFICSFEFDNIFNEFTNKNLIGRFHIINNDNIIIATLEKKLLLSNVDKAFSENMVSFINSVKQDSVSENETITFKGPSKTNRIGVVKKINNYDFYAIYAESEDAAISYVKSMAAKSIIFGIMLLIISNVIIMFAISIPLKNLKYLKEKIISAAQNKNLNMVIEVKSNDELAEITKSVNSFISSIKDVVSEVRSSVIDVASANNQLAATMEELSTTFNSQSHQVSEMVGGIEESNAAVNEVNNTVSHIQQRTERLKSLIEQFKTNNM